MVGYNPLFLLDKINDLTIESIYETTVSRRKKMDDKNSNVIPLTKDGICVSKWRTTSFLYKSNWGMDDPEDTLKITNAELRKILGVDPDSESA